MTRKDAIYCIRCAIGPGPRCDHCDHPMNFAGHDCELAQLLDWLADARNSEEVLDDNGYPQWAWVLRND